MSEPASALDLAAVDRQRRALALAAELAHSTVSLDHMLRAVRTQDPSLITALKVIRMVEPLLSLREAAARLAVSATWHDERESLLTLANSPVDAEDVDGR